MPNPPKPAQRSARRPQRIPPDQAPSEVLERLLQRKQVQVQAGDVVITRERVPRVNTATTLPLPWRYCVRVFPEPKGQSYTGFQHAASAAEELASNRKARVLYIETDQPALLADHRR